MPFDNLLRQIAEQSGIQQEFWDIFGRRHEATPEINRAILTALGLDCADEAALAVSVTAGEDAEWNAALPGVLVLLQSEGLRFPLRAEADTSVSLRLESGEMQTYSVCLSEHAVHRERGAQVERLVVLPVELPLGYHELQCNASVCRLIITPPRAIQPTRCAGFGVTLWSLRSEQNWGTGDFTDLTHLATWARSELHAAFLALNPLHAIQNRRPYNSSPYLPNGTFCRNFLYLDVTAVPGYVETPEILAEAAALRASEVVEYERIAALKLDVLSKIYAQHPPNDEAKAWIAAEGDLLHLYCIYAALDEHLHAENPELWIWPDWPAEFRDPGSPAVTAFAQQYADRIQFHGWLQWLVDQQLAAVQSHCKAIGMSIGLYHDLALATDRCGSDLWAHRPFYMAGCRVGSPPDDFSPTGQDWSFPPPNTKKHRQDGYRLFVESIRKSLRHGGALRMDHVMRLFRLYWIPEGHDATQGAYVRDFGQDLVRILALESVRNQVLMIGEDLGTVEPHVREVLAATGILSYRLLYFERRDGQFKLPNEYPEQSLSASTTHDLPTITGFWTGADIAARLHAGRLDPETHRAQLEDRIREKQRLLDALFAVGLMPETHGRDASTIPDMTPEIHYAITGFLAGTGSALWLVNQEDMTKEPNQQNLPGTTMEYPNWSRKMKWSLEDLVTLQEAKDCAAMVRHWIERTKRA